MHWKQKIMLVLLCLFSSVVSAASLTMVSTPMAIHRLDEATCLLMKFPEKQTALNPNAKMEQILVTVRYGQPVLASAQVCNAQKKDCHQVGPDHRISGSFFNYQNITKPIWLCVAVHTWYGYYPPVFVYAEYTAWTRRQFK